MARGNDLFEMHCSGCHSRRRLDLGKVPPDLHGVFDRRFLPSGRSATDDLVRSTILTGRSGIMPSFEGSLSDENIDDIILYLHTLKALPRAATPVSDRSFLVLPNNSGREAPSVLVVHSFRSRQERQYLADMLVIKAFFDQVSAPPGEITVDAGIALLQQALNRLRQNLATPIEGLSRIADEIKEAPEETEVMISGTQN